MKLVDREMDRRNVLGDDLERARAARILLFTLLFLLLYFLSLLFDRFKVQTATDKIAAKETFQKAAQKVERIKSKQESLLAGMFNSPVPVLALSHLTLLSPPSFVSTYLLHLISSHLASFRLASSRLTLLYLLNNFSSVLQCVTTPCGRHGHREEDEEAQHREELGGCARC